MRKIKLSEKKRKWVGNRKDVTLRGEKLNYNVSIQRKYIKDLYGLVDEMTSINKEEIIKYFNTKNVKEFYTEDASVTSGAKKITDSLTEKFNRLFGKKAKNIALKMV